MNPKALKIWVVFLALASPLFVLFSGNAEGHLNIPGALFCFVCLMPFWIILTWD